MTTQTLTDQPIFVIVDLFCGAGGSSTGAEKAIEELGGIMELAAVNHWPIAVETHQLNHPTARHYVQDLDHADPEEIVPEGSIDILLASPECRFFSRARGGKPVNDQGRMHPWTVNRWITSLRIRCLIVENVPEFVSWGPLLEDYKPDKTKKGLYFQEWVRSLWGLGYQVEWRMLNAADYGDATTRTRFFLQARNDNKPIRWPKATHSRTPGPDMINNLPRWRSARDIIDWTNPGRSLLDDPKYRKKPLSDKTKQRIARGLERFGGPLAHLYVRLLDLPDQKPIANTRPVPNATEDKQPFILNRNGENGFTRFHSVDNPMPTATARGAGYLIEPEAKLIQPQNAKADSNAGTLNSGTLNSAEQDKEAEPFIGANRTGNVPRSIDDPIPPVTTAHGGGNYLVEPDLAPFILSQQSGGAPRALDQPIPTITGDGAISLVQPSIIEYYGQSSARAASDPLSTITSNRKHALIQAKMTRHPITFHQDQQETDQEETDQQETDQSAETSAADQTMRTELKFRQGLANPTLVEINHGNFPTDQNPNDRRTHSIDDPLGVITTIRNIGLAQPMLVQTSQTGGNGSYVRPTRDPLPTITTRNDTAIATPSINEYGNERPEQPSGSNGQPTPEAFAQLILHQAQAAGLDPRRLVFIDGQPFVLDIHFRMLQNSELARAMGFEDEETTYEFVGNIGEITKQIGNAVPVHLAQALVKAALAPEAE